VDDTPANIDVLRQVLTTEGLNISMAPNGEEALKIVSQSAPDLILLDIMMPGIDGFETCRRLKKNEATKSIAVIFISAKIETEKIIKGFSLGGVDYITKPFRQEELLSKVKTHLQIKKLMLEQKKLITKLDAISREDPLTGLSNRRDLIEKIEYERSRFERVKKPFSLIMADIDHFKKINDTYGHDAGDYVLTRTADLMKDIARKLDTVARWGGEEFLLLLPETELKGATNLAEKLRETICLINFVQEDNKFNITVSFGVNCYTNKEISVDEFLKSTDTCLYQAKETGRNKVVSLFNN